MCTHDAVHQVLACTGHFPNCIRLRCYVRSVLPPPEYVCSMNVEVYVYADSQSTYIRM